MNIAPIDTDYLVIGAGATAMAFVDTLLSETDARVVMVDRHARPGGHWNDAYPFVRLHQPSAFYGVASRELSDWQKDRTGLNAGLYGLASGAEVLAHFDAVMQSRFLPSGRVRWLPMSDCALDDEASPDGSHHVRSLTSGDVTRIAVRKKLVDATHAQTAVPSTHAPKYGVAPGVSCIPPNKLPEVDRSHARYTVVGSGKTGMDAVLWLLQNGVAPGQLRWIMPRDAWLLDRANGQPGADDFERAIGSTTAQFDAILAASSVPDLFERLESGGQLLRIDPTVAPSTYRCAVVSRAELAQLRRVQDVVRLGRMHRIEARRIVLEQGSVEADPDTLYVDCSASAIVMPPRLPVFDGDRINLLMVRWCQPLFSAALTAWVESHVADAAEQNALCGVVPSPERPVDWLRMWGATIVNAGRWKQHPALSAWLAQCRLNSLTGMLRGVDLNDPAKAALLKENGSKAGAAAQKIPALLSQLA